MQSQFLQKKYQARPDEGSLYHRGRIKITSPDQFVPLFLANYGNEAFPGSAVEISSPITLDPSKSVFISPTTRNDLTNMRVQPTHKNDGTVRKVYKGIIMENLKNILNSSLPTEYSFVDPRGLSTSSYGPSVNYSFEYFVSMTSHIALIARDYQYLSALGVLCEINTTLRSTSRSSMYAPFNYTLPNHLMVPQVVMLIKYKYLAKARAALFLQTNLDIPHDGLKLLRAQVFSNNQIRSLYEERIHPMCREAEMNIEYATKEVLSSYLFAPLVKKTKEQCIADAIKNLTVIEPHVVF